ncbi:hypothetical protein V8G69_15575 [Gaetbulibacter sp. M235]|uniref:hypothetical protein n=1 Tax=Gaetbulibacter sp. M235 TaxID=3126510 RepID=UPI00374F05B1
MNQLLTTIFIIQTETETETVVYFNYLSNKISQVEIGNKYTFQYRISSLVPKGKDG